MCQNLFLISPVLVGTEVHDFCSVSRDTALGSQIRRVASGSPKREYRV